MPEIIAKQEASAKKYEKARQNPAFKNQSLALAGIFNSQAEYSSPNRH